MQFQESGNLNTLRPSSLLVDGKLFTMAPPTYGNLPADQVINVKMVANLPVFGNGIHDDTEKYQQYFRTEHRKSYLFPSRYILSVQHSHYTTGISRRRRCICVILQRHWR